MKRGQWIYQVRISQYGVVTEVSKFRLIPGGSFLYTQIQRNRDGTFNSYNGNPWTGGPELKRVDLDQACSIVDEDFIRRFKKLFEFSGVPLRPRQVRSLIRERIPLKIHVEWGFVSALAG